MNQISNQIKRGFTVVEQIVAMSLFSILLAISVGVFIHALRTERAITASISVNNNASLTLEQIAREARTGSSFCVDASNNDICAAGGSPNEFKELKFVNAAGENISYALDNGKIVRDAAEDSNPPAPITANNVNIKKLSFFLRGQHQSDKKNPRITVVLQISTAGISFLNSTINLETTVSPRVLRD